MNGVVRLTDRPEMTIGVYRGRKATMNTTTKTFAVTQLGLMLLLAQISRYSFRCLERLVHFSFTVKIQNIGTERS